jgi:hypothetical protein
VAAPLPRDPLWRRVGRRAVLARARRVRSSPPAVPDGWATSPPDFVGVGAQRAGTSWWFSLIAQHPGVVSDARKELHYFDRFCLTPFSESDGPKYHRFFPRPANGIAGEWTPGYMYNFWIPPLLAKAAPEAKILVLLRDPIERYRSGFTLAVSTMRKPRISTVQLRSTDQLHRSLYFEQLTRLLEHFDRGQVLILQYERCLEDPVSQLRRTYEFLELEPHDHSPRSVRDRVGRPRPSAELSEELMRALRDRMVDDVSRLGQRFGAEIDFAVWPNFQDLG